MKARLGGSQTGDEFDEPSSHPRPVSFALGRPLQGELKIIAAILERAVIKKILAHLGLDPQLPPKGRGRKAGQDFVT